MALCLQKLYEDTKDLEMRLVAGKKGMKNLVSGIHMVEHEEISSFLEEGEIVFMTGAGLEQEDSLFRLVQMNHANGASGMVVNIGPFIHKIPDEIKQYCDDNSFPLFEVPWHIQMMKIMKKCMTEVMRSEQARMELSAVMEAVILSPGQAERYLPQLERYHIEAEWNYCVGVLEGGDQWESGLQAYKKTAAERFLLNHYPKTMFFEMDRRYVVVFFNYEEPEADAGMRRLIKELTWNPGSSGGLMCGIGQTVHGIRCAGASYRQALDVIDMKKKGLPGDLLLYRELGLCRLLLPLKNEEVLEEFYKEFLQPLVHYDQANQTDYRKLLECYFDNNCNIHETAERLYVHRNTINYKLNKIEKILSCSLSNLEDRTRLKLALLIEKILRP